MPYMTGSPLVMMAPLAFRPAHVPDAAKQASEDTAMDPDTTPDTAMAQTTTGDMVMDTSVDELRLHRLAVKNRRKRYLDMHPEYFADASLELAHPLLFDRLIRRFQTAAEREADGRRKGFSGNMATDLWRAEAKKDALAQPDPYSLFTYHRGPLGQIVAEDKDDVPMTKEEGRAWWVDEMTQRFLRGGDEDFEYAKIDHSPAYDDPEWERDLQDAWFESMESDFDSDGEGKEKILVGETGIQDY